MGSSEKHPTLSIAKHCANNFPLEKYQRELEPLDVMFLVEEERTRILTFGASISKHIVRHAVGAQRLSIAVFKRGRALKAKKKN